MGATALSCSVPLHTSHLAEHSQYGYSTGSAPEYPQTPYNTPAPYSMLSDAQDIGGGGGWDLLGPSSMSDVAAALRDVSEEVGTDGD